MTRTEELLSISSESLSRHPVSINPPDFSGYGQLGTQLKALLSVKNGFYAFESALHVFPAAPYETEMTLGRWNSFGLWWHEYGDLIGDVLFFAEDAFGDQFCLSDKHVLSFNAETGEMKIIGENLEEWAKCILEDYAPLTGYPLMHKWQDCYGQLPIGTRLMPKIPFALGGEYSLHNLYVLASVSAMKSRGFFARQIKDLPDGAQVQFRIVE